MSQPFQSCGINYANPSVIGGTGSGLKVFPSLYNTAAPATLQVLEQQQGQLITLKAAGSLKVHGTSPTIVPTIYNGTSLTAGSDGTALTLLTSAQLFSSTGATYPFALTCQFQGDAASGVFQVVSTTWACNGVVSSSFTNTSLTGVTFGKISGGDGTYLPENPINLIFALNFGVSDSTNSASLYQYELHA